MHPVSNEVEVGDLSLANISFALQNQLGTVQSFVS